MIGVTNLNNENTSNHVLNNIPFLKRHTYFRNVILFLTAALILLVTPAGFADILFSSDGWTFDPVDRGAVIRKKLSVENGDNTTVKIDIISTCDCLSVTPGTAAVEPGQSVFFELVFDTTDYSGQIQKHYIVQTTSPSLRKAFFPVTGTVLTTESQPSGAESAGNGQQRAASDHGAAVTEKKSKGRRFTFLYYYTPGCKQCSRFLNETVPAIEKKYDVTLRIIEKDIYDPEVYDELMNRLDDFSLSKIEVPIIYLPEIEELYAGEKEIEQRFVSGFDDIAATIEKEPGPARRTSESVSSSSQDVRASLKIIPILVAGLGDGINPCAFTTLLFLLSSLAVIGRTRREIFIIGLFFTAAVFVTYFLLGIGIFSALRKVESFPLISKIIHYALLTLVVVLGAMSLYDFALVKKGKAEKMTLQLPKALKKRIHDSIRERKRSMALISASLGLGFLISIFELACTGQIYLPTIAYLVRVERTLTSYLYLVLYNVGFIVPLLVVFSLTYAGVGSEKFVAFFNNRLGAVKLGTALLFFGLAFLMLFIVP